MPPGGQMRQRLHQLSGYHMWYGCTTCRNTTQPTTRATGKIEAPPWDMPSNSHIRLLSNLAAQLANMVWFLSTDYARMKIPQCSEKINALRTTPVHSPCSTVYKVQYKSCSVMQVITISLNRLEYNELDTTAINWNMHWPCNIARSSTKEWKCFSTRHICLVLKTI